jgi:UDP-N-acetylmuramate--alanine ligase
MASLMEGKRVIAVAGTHGKTTTTAMIVLILRECGKDPSYIVGGVMRNTGTNAGVGQGEYFVIEADEYDNMFLGLKPDIAVITNIEYDHPDFFKSPEDLYRSFEQFAGLLPKNGKLIGCVDSPPVLRLLQSKKKQYYSTISYGIENLRFASCRGVNLRVDTHGYSTFDLKYASTTLTTMRIKVGRKLTLRMSVPGRQNVQNALAALVVVEFASSEAIPFVHIANALASFQGTGRRFELRDEIAGVAVIDDYAHHPTAIKVTLDAARQRYPDRQIWAVWQPHTYSRTQALMDEYVTAFDTADHVFITDIYAAREQPVPGVTSAGVVAKMNHPDARHTPTFDDTVAVLDEEVQAPAVILIMSAGDAPAIGVEYLRRRQARHETVNPAR